MRITRVLIPLVIFVFISGLLGLQKARAVSVQIAENSRTEVLPLDRAIAMALTNNLDVRWNRTDLKIAGDQIRYAWGAFDPILGISATRESNEITQNASQFASSLGIAGPARLYSEENDRYQSSLEGKTPLGTRYTLGLRANKLDNTLNENASYSIWSPEYDSFAGISLNQPLLRDFGPGVNMAEIRIARKNKEITRLTWEGKIISAVQAVLTTYYEMQYSVAAIQIREQAIEADKKFVRENQRRMELGLMSPYDVRQAEVALSTDEENLISAKNYFMERQFQLKRQILSAVDIDNDAVFIPTGELKATPIALDRNKLLSDAFEFRLDYQQAIKEAEIQNIRLRYAKNQLWPRLDLVGTYGYNGLQGNYKDSLSNAFTTRTPSWSLGLQASIPIGHVQARAQYGVIKSLKEQAILKIKQVELNTSLDVETMISRIQANLQSVETSRQTRHLAEEAMRIQEKQIEQGLISVFDALETKKKLYDTMLREAAAVAELNKSYVLLDVATGTLLKKHSITVVE